MKNRSSLAEKSSTDPVSTDVAAITAGYRGGLLQGGKRMLSESVWMMAVYALALNVLTYGLFALDKRQAVRNAWRVPERHLLLAVLLGGWAGAMLAMRICRHKRKKTSFLLRFALALIVHLLIIMVLFLIFSDAEYAAWWK
ncbi:DUF1294 domain-containing protein [Undibacterium luofuense]|uniref:DUF1294 domain-containing protein n=1 Tax=Undibacterium luofuense TaxID=2828733 RepID=A0A941DJS1_9BURK|nr:DUF1294 domain-containing protein [Undibacterium luofuense]MBR7781319.1 DUF1294 domain-containing protein [Undibacterium luofuense]